MSLLIDFSLFRRNTNFLFLFIGQFVSMMGTMITSVALPYQIYTQTHSILMVGLLSLCQLLPLLITALIGGVFADKYHRRLLLLVAEAALALGSSLLALNMLLPTPSIVLLFIVALFMSAFNGLHRPALDSIVQQIVARKDFPTVSALGTFKGSVAMIVGPAIGGVIIAAYGLLVTYIIDVASFVVSVGALLLMSHIPKPLASSDDSTFGSLKKGLKYALSRQELVGTYAVDFLAMIFGMPTALFPAIANQFGGGPKALGMLYAAPAVGALLISFISGWTAKVTRQGRAIAISAALWGLAILFFGISSNFTLALFFLALSGSFDALSGIFRATMWNETIPNEIRGRMSGIEMISYLSGPRLGDAEAGLVASVVGITTCIVSGGILCIVSVVACCYWLPKFWAYDSRHS